MTMVSSFPFEGGEAIESWFGRSPTFHDAEIASLSLDRAGPSTMTVYWFCTTAQTDERGYYILDKHALVTFRMDQVFDLKLSGFNGQNVIFNLAIGKRPDSDPGYDIEIETSHGLSGRISCRSLALSLKPVDNPSRPSAAS